MKPLFIPLKREYYEAFVDGTKTVEYRKNGPRWNAQTCVVGRPVVISLGYGKQNRRFGFVVSFEVSSEPTKTDAWRDCYGDYEGDAACIGIKLNSEY